MSHYVYQAVQEHELWHIIASGLAVVVCAISGLFVRAAATQVLRAQNQMDELRDDITTIREDVAWLKGARAAKQGQD